MDHPETPLNGSAAEIVCEWAESFIEDWRTDEGNDPEQQANADEAASDMERFRPFLVAAASAYTPDVITTMRRQLRIVRGAMERARDVLAIAAETHPDDGTGGILLPGCQPEPDSGGIAGDCEAAAQDAVEGIWFIDQVMAALPLALPAGEGAAEDIKALADARLEAQRRLSSADLDQLAWAVQWAGHFAIQTQADAGGPAFSTIAKATTILESRGVGIYHSRAARAKIEATNQPKGEGN